MLTFRNTLVGGDRQFPLAYHWRATTCRNLRATVLDMGVSCGFTATHEAGPYIFDYLGPILRSTRSHFTTTVLIPSLRHEAVLVPHFGLPGLHCAGHAYSDSRRASNHLVRCLRLFDNRRLYRLSQQLGFWTSYLWISVHDFQLRLEQVILLVNKLDLAGRQHSRQVVLQRCSGESKQEAVCNQLDPFYLDLEVRPHPCISVRLVAHT